MLECLPYACLLFCTEPLHKLGLKFAAKEHHLLKYLLACWSERYQSKAIIMWVNAAAQQAGGFHLFSETRDQSRFHAQALCQFRLANFSCMHQFMQEHHA